MTTWLTGNDPDVWCAAVAGAPVTDYVDQYALSDINSGFGWGFRELPWSVAGQKIRREQSPIGHLYRATTPTLILCDTGDLRVPITESYNRYHVLSDGGIPVEFVAHPVPGHFPADPVHTRDVFRRWGDWIARWFDDPSDNPSPRQPLTQVDFSSRHDNPMAVFGRIRLRSSNKKSTWVRGCVVRATCSVVRPQLGIPAGRMFLDGLSQEPRGVFAAQLRRRPSTSR